MAISQARIWTYDDYMRMPDDGKRYEILDGELIELTSPNRQHQQILGRLFRVLSEYVENNVLGEVYIGPFDVRLSLINVIQPDVLFISTNNLRILDNDLNVQGAPDLCVEILSPSTRRRDLAQKRDIYARFGVREYWLVDPDAERVTVLTLDAGRYVPWGEANGDAGVPSLVLPDLPVVAASLFPSA